MDVLGGYGANQACETLDRAYQKKMSTYTERVTMAVEQAEQQLKDLKRMQEIFAQHPEFEELLTLVQRGRV